MNVRSALTLASHVATSKATLPILATVRFADGELTASDLDQELRIPLEGALPKGAPFCVSAARLTRILKALPDEADVKFRLKADRLHIACGTARYELKTLPADDFPAMKPPEGIDEPSAFTVAGEDLAAALAFVAPAMADKDIRYYLNGLHMAAGAGALVLTATDGHRLHRVRVTLDDAPDVAAAAGIVPRVSVPRLAELAAEHGTLSLELSRHRLAVDCDETLTVKLIDGAFPDADRVIPASRPVTASVNGKDLAAAIRRVTPIMTGESHLGVRLDFQRAAIEINCRNRETEVGVETFAWARADTATGPETGFDAAFLLDALDAFTTDIVHLHLGTTEAEALYITDGDAGRRQAVVMPMRI